MIRGIENNKNEYRNKKIYINDNMTRQRYKQRKYRKITAKFQNFGKSKKISRTLNRYHIHRVEARYAAGNPKTERGTRYRKTKKNFRNRTN